MDWRVKGVCQWCWLLAFGCWLLAELGAVVGGWLLVTSNWLLVIGNWLLVNGCWLVVAALVAVGLELFEFLSVLLQFLGGRFVVDQFLKIRLASIYPRCEPEVAD